MICCFQCFTHRYLGWKINVHDSCDEQSAASHLQPAVVPAPEKFTDKSDVDLEESPSTKIETRVKPNDLIIVDKEDKESKSVLSEKKIVDIPIVPRSTPGQTQEHSPAQVSFIHAPQQAFLDTHARSPAHLYQHLQHLHKQQLNAYYLRPSKPLQNLYNSTTISFEPFSSSNTNLTSDRIIAQAAAQTTPNLFDSSLDLNSSFLVPPPPNFPPKFNDLTLPRPLSGPQTHPKRSNTMKFIGRYPAIPPMRAKPYKKYFQRSPYQGPRPYNYEFDRPNAYPSRLQPLLIKSQSVPIIARSPSNETFFGTIKEVKNVEISPEQPSTESEPEIQTASSANIIDITPTFTRPAVNTGFKPSSVKMETGFKPIITKELQDRMDQTEDEIDIKDEGETGVIDKDHENNYEYKPIHAFEPMFFPSPTDKFVREKNFKGSKRAVNKKHDHYLKIVIKQPRNIIENEDELVAEAAERSETYYLPPKGHIPVNVAKERSNIDIETPESDINIDSPPDVVVTYDGKRVSGQSLTAKISDRPAALDTRFAKASTFIKARPQFVKYSGELPPLNPESLFGGVPRQNTGVISRELDTPELPPTVHAPLSSTKLSRVTRFKEGSGREKIIPLSNKGKISSH